MAKIYRVDKFQVPASARAEFLAQIESTHNLLKTFAGFCQQLLLEQVSGPGVFNLVTLVEWESQTAMDAAREVMQRHYAETGFNPQALMTRLGVQADLGNYQALSL